MIRDLMRKWSAERTAFWGLVGAVVAYAALTLWLTRGASFTKEEFIYIGESNGFSPSSIMDPFGGHLTAITRLLFEVNLRVFGPAYVPFRLVVIVLVATVAALLFVLVRRRVGPLPALAAAVIVLFLGTTPEVMEGWTTMWVQATAAGLGALVVLDRGGRRSDAIACALLVVSVLSFSIGVAFAIGVAAWILAEGGRRRLWVAAVPLLVFAAWWLWALKFDEGFQTLSNILLVPTWAADSLAAAGSSISGLGVDLTKPVDPITIPLGWGRIVAAGCIALAVWGLRRRGPSPLAWAAGAFLVSMWFAEALSYSSETFTKRTPDLDRYAYPVSVGLLLFLAASHRGWVPSRRALVTIFGILLFALPVNIWQMRERGEVVRTESETAQARLAMIELEAANVSPDFRAIQPGDGVVPYAAGGYLAAVDRFGSFGLSLDELESASEDVRAAADETLGDIVRPALAVADVRRPECGPPAGEVELPTGGAVVSSEQGGDLMLRRFGDVASINAGNLAPGEPGAIDLPDDAADRPWYASVAGGTVSVCGNLKVP